LKELLDQPNRLDPRLDHLELPQLLEIAHFLELDLGHHLVYHHEHFLIDLVLDQVH
jgi:hypothetical protein